MSLKEVSSQIKRKNNFLISSHVNLEGDAFGSELAFLQLVKKLGKNGVIVNEDNIPYGYEFMPQAASAIKYKQNMPAVDFDCFAVLDCSDLSRTGEVYRLNQGINKPVINIDHHISNTNFGDYRWVEPCASSACEMIYKLYKELGVELDKDSALCLYTGILTDTGSFRYSNTSGQTHKIISELMAYGLSASEVYYKVYGNIPFSDMKLLAGLLSRIKRRCQGRIIWFEARQGMLKKYKKIQTDLTDHVLGYGRLIKNAEVAILFKENLGVKNEVRINFRSQGEVDVNKIAAFFGGGGHRTASGATLRGSLASIRQKVLRKIEESLSEV